MTGAIPKAFRGDAAVSKTAERGSSPRRGASPMIDCIILADASKVSAADFVRMFAPRKSKLTLLCEQLWQAAVDGDREQCRRIHVEIAGLGGRSA